MLIMTRVRVKGIQRFKHSQSGIWYTYHRKTGTRIHAEFGTAEFFEELAALERRVKRAEARPGSLGMVIEQYKRSSAWAGLAQATRTSYQRAFEVLKPLVDMPVAEIDRPFVVTLREEKIFPKRGRWMANYVVTVMSLLFEYAIDRGWMKANPADGVKRIKRDRKRPRANRPWSESECRIVMERAPSQLRVPIALAMCTGFRKADVLTVTKAAVRDGMISVTTSKRQVPVAVPVHRLLAEAIAVAPESDAVQLSVTSKGRPWTESGFNSTFGKFIDRLEAEGAVGPGLTMHGLRHTLGTRLREVTDDLDLIRRILGQQTLSLAQHYSETADTSRQARKAVHKLDFTGNK
jgi:integrase